MSTVVTLSLLRLITVALPRLPFAFSPDDPSLVAAIVCLPPRNRINDMQLPFADYRLVSPLGLVVYILIDS